MIKHDDSGAGDGNVVLDLRPMHHADDPDAWLRAQVEALPEWYRSDLAARRHRRGADRRHAVLEPERAGRHPAGRRGRRARDPRAGPRRRGRPGLPRLPVPGRPGLRAGAREHAAKIGEQLAAQGALGRFSVDFVAAATPTGDRGTSTRSRSTCARAARRTRTRRSGTSSPGATTRPAGSGSPRTARRGPTASTDNLVHESWLGLEPADVIDSVARAGLQFDPAPGPASCSTCCPASRSMAGSAHGDREAWGGGRGHAGCDEGCDRRHGPLRRTVALAGLAGHA